MAPDSSFNLSPQKRELLARLLKEKGLSNQQAALAVQPRPTGTPPVLSFAQERLWYLEKLVPNNPAYNIPVAFRLTGALDTVTLQQSLNLVIARHESLRALFDLESTEPSQQIQESLTINLPVEDFPTDANLDEILTAEARRPFNLESGPLVRAKLLKIGPEEHIFLFTIHHIIADGWSLAVFFKEMSASYAAMKAGQTPALPEPVVQYPDFARWQRERLSGDRLDRQMAYWKGQLGGERPELVLPMEKKRPSTPTFDGRWITVSIPAELLSAIKALAQAEGTTLFVLLLAAFNTLLHRYSGQKDILLGSPVTNRIQHDLEGVIGHFINTLVMRTDFSGQPTFSQLLQRQKQVVLDAFSNQDIPFEYLIDTLQPSRDISKNPLFQTAFNLQDTPAQANWRTALDLVDISAEQLFIHSQTAKLDLTIEAEVIGGELLLSFEYNSDIFTADTIKRMAGHFQSLLAGIAANPNQPLTHYTLLSTEEIQELTLWNERQTDYPKEKCLHEVFEENVCRNPDAIALMMGDRQLSYGELNGRANELAHYLQKLGVRPNVTVGVCANRSFAFITALLAVLKAGGTYVPIHPEYPQERVSYMLENAKSPVLLLQSHLKGSLVHENGSTILLDGDTWSTLDDAVPLPAARADLRENLDVGNNSLNAACIIFTSGSTGRPKGVALPHMGINRLVMNTNYMTFEPDDVINHISSPAFDAASFEIWGALMNGLPLAIAPHETVLVPDELANHIIKKRVSVTFMITSLFNQMAYNRPDVFDHLRIVKFGGEAVDPRAVKLVLEKHPPQNLLHVYGPTESSTYATFYPIPSVSEEARTVSIGYPLANSTVWVVDKNLNPVPVGIPGELCIGGDGLAWGYYDLPGKTAGVFVPDPFSKSAGGRLYKTGDMVRLRPDSSGQDTLAIEFIGRIDNQVKIRGFRIEMGEIETVINSFSAVQDCYVMAREDVPGVKRIVAYLVAKAGQTISQLELRHHLQNRLPDYMIPIAYVILESLPHNITGKVDWRALPIPTMERPQIDSQFAAPQSSIEQTIAEIWQEVLQLQQVGRYDNFFDLGGNSLLLVRVHDKLQHAFAQKIPIVQLFTHSTVSDLAKHLDQPVGQDVQESAVISAGMERGHQRRARRQRRNR